MYWALLVDKAVNDHCDRGARLTEAGSRSGRSGRVAVEMEGVRSRLHTKAGIKPANAVPHLEP